MADLSNDIAQQAVEPLTSAADGQSATGRPVADLATAENHVNALSALRKRRRGVSFTKLVPPGALPDCGGLTTGPFSGGLY